ncbi:hypothetical protein GOP47_0009380 [Adiantum capillus-veneris]|uniref:DCD domain-containing protein n=1 Tax=Adiantum capillus-veneris TaxID=13818 RepID=A0A9D4UWH6_ADICA|nr:hypothetical protein GOP47_0009380 [Adiantum capillus-veneris]
MPDIGNTRALAGLIVMCNDKVRRSFFKYGVLGVPLRKKPNLDRVDASTLIFLFEFEARALWGIYQASSEVSIDIEKDAYRGSETAFPAQVKFHILRKCRPLPEKLFKLAIADNYYTPTKFHFELMEEQVTFLTRLYYVRDAEKLRLNNRALLTEEATTLYETADEQRFLEGSVYQVDCVRTNDRNTSNPHETISGLSQCKQLLLRGGDNSEAHTSAADENLPDGAAYDHPRTSSLYCYPHMEEDILSEEHLRRQRCQPKHFHYAGNPKYKSCDPSKSFPDAAMESNARTKQSSDEENYLHLLELGQLNGGIHSRLLTLRNPQPDISACQRLHRGNSACGVALCNLDLHSKRRLNPMDQPENHRMELTPDLQAWEMHETIKDQGNEHTIETLKKRRLISSEDAYVNTHYYSVDGFSARGKSCAESHDDTVEGDSGRSQEASTCIRRRAPPEEVWQGDLCRRRLMMLRSKSVQDVEVENPVCIAECCISKRETVQLKDDEQWLQSILCNVKDHTKRNHEVGDGGACVGDNGHVSGDTSTIMSKSCNVVNLLKAEEQDIQVQADQNSVPELHSRRSHQKLSSCASIAHNEVEYVKPPRKSVWSRLSASRNWLDSRQISIPNEGMQSELNNLLFSEALPFKRKVEDITEYEVDERSSHNDDDSSAFVEDGFNVQFKRRKLGTSRKADPSNTSQEQGGVDDTNINPIDRMHSNHPRERRKIRRPL